MSDIAIRCEGLGKRYRIGERERYKALRDVITDAAASPFRKLRNAVMGKRQGASNGNGNEATSLTASPLPLSPPDGNGHSSSSLITHDSSLLSQPPISDLGSPTSDLFWALKDVSFEVKRGEVVGIIGRNGAGKSTLLKILSRITAPTEGEVEVRGRVGSLLEVGTGFHPELTGRENIYLNGAILGMKRAEINRKFDEIVAFAEIEKFIDTPVKRYSSGMYVRLAFAVAAHLEPEILVVDEVLAVGDAQFQKKCLGKMGDVAKEGRTVLFVSHAMGAVKRLCEKTIYLQQGHLQAFGPTNRIIGSYVSEGLLAQGVVTWEEEDPQAGDAFLRLHSLSLRNQRGESTTDFDFLEPILIEVDYTVKESASSRLTVWIYSEDGVLLLVTGEDGSLVDIGRKESGRYTATCVVPPHLLNNARYFVSVKVDIPNFKSICANENILSFEVHATSGLVAQRERAYGLVCPPIEWNVVFQKSTMCRA